MSLVRLYAGPKPSSIQKVTNEGSYFLLKQQNVSDVDPSYKCLTVELAVSYEVKSSATHLPNQCFSSFLSHGEVDLKTHRQVRAAADHKPRLPLAETPVVFYEVLKINDGRRAPGLASVSSA